MVPSSEHHREAAAASDSPADSLNLRLKCPRCGVEGRVKWKSLRHGMKCRKCDCQFLIASDGKLVAQADLPQVRFDCPRCGTSGSMPAMVAARGGRCPSCQTPLAPDHDHNLLGIEEAAAARRTANVKQQVRKAAERKSQRASAEGGVYLSPATKRALYVALGLGALLTAWLVYRAGQGGRPDSLGERFTRTCLAGDWDAALGYLEDDPVQQAEFKRWRTRHFPSILDAHRPQGDTMQIDVDTTTESAAGKVFRITLRSPFVGERAHMQHWAKREGRWVFDVVATLAEQDRPTPP